MKKALAAILSLALAAPLHAVTIITGPARPSQVTGRTYKTAFLSNLTSNTTAYTVGSGKKLYVTQMSVTAYNLSGTGGSLVIQDGGTSRMPVVVSSGTVTVSVNNDYPEPLQFSTSVNANVAAGQLTYSLELTGYEE